VLDPAIVQDCSLVKLNSSPVNGSCKGNLIGMEILPAGFANDLVRGISKDIFD
jgi:hypothetical protein